MEFIQESPIFFLNHDCLREIFSYLSYRDKLTIDSTCQYMRNLKNWVIGLEDLTKLDVYGKQHDLHLTDWEIAVIIRRNAHQLESLKLSVSADEKRLRALTEGCDILQELDLWFMLKDYTAEHMLLISQVWEGNRLPNLKILRLENLPHNSWEFCRTIPKHVEKMHLHGCGMYRGEICFRFEGFIKLKELELKCFDLSPNDLSGLESLTINTLKIVSCTVTVDFVTRIIRLPTIKDLTLDSAWDVDTENFVELGKNSQIESLKLRSIRLGLKENCLRELSQMKNLRRLSLKQTQVYGAHLLSTLVDLEEIITCECYAITTDIIIALVTNATKLKYIGVYEHYKNRDFVRALSRILREQPGRSLTFEIHEDLKTWVENERLHPSLKFVFIP